MRKVILTLIASWMLYKIFYYHIDDKKLDNQASISDNSQICEQNDNQLNLLQYGINVTDVDVKNLTLEGGFSQKSYYKLRSKSAVQEQGNIVRLEMVDAIYEIDQNQQIFFTSNSANLNQKSQIIDLLGCIVIKSGEYEIRGNKMQIDFANLSMLAEDGVYLEYENINLSSQSCSVQDNSIIFNGNVKTNFSFSDNNK